MRVHEIFHSIQGEGLLTGVPTVFVRTAGCNLRCAWCDTPGARTGGREMEPGAVADEVKRFGSRDVCITGGEPLHQKEAGELALRLLGDGYRVMVKTNGTLPVSELARAAGPRRDALLLSVDVKCPSSGEAGRFMEENLASMTVRDEVKFVVADRDDYGYAARFLAGHALPCEAVLQPVWGTDPSWLAESLLRDGLRARLMLQTHKYIWGPVEGR